MKRFIFAVIISVTMFSCSDDPDEKEPITFLEKHNLSEWERTDNNPDRGYQHFMRILNNSNKLTEIWYTTTVDIPDYDCYHKVRELFDITILINTENNLHFEGVNGSDVKSTIVLSVKNDELKEVRTIHTREGPSEYSYTWVKSNVNVDGLKLCD